MQRDCDAVVIGGGVVGAAVAAGLARRGLAVMGFERREAFALETSSRNSEVIHAGIYYPPGSWKARLCVSGREALYAFCAERRVPHRKLGKWIVATHADEHAVLEDLRARGTENGVPGLRFLGEAERRAEPSLACIAALESPETGIVDSHALCAALVAESESLGTVWLLEREVRGIERVSAGYRLEVHSEAHGTERVSAACVVNAAGLFSDRVAALAGIDLDAAGYRLYWCKGDYFALARRDALVVSRLLYPVPTGAGLGVHVTLDLAGGVRFGPDAHYVDTLDYGVDASRAGAFGGALRRYLPALEDAWLVPAFAGLRPKLSGPGEGVRDFVLAEESARGLPGFVNLIGIESPGLTASLAIADAVTEMVRSV
ncbi:MAG: NAD(P)/FAD-dependent oxidoreductase [Myxococcota bacterium]